VQRRENGLGKKDQVKGGGGGGTPSGFREVWAIQQHEEEERMVSTSSKLLSALTPHRHGY